MDTIGMLDSWLNRTISFVRFAEAKNASLLAILVACTVAMARRSDLDSISWPASIFLLLSITLSVIIYIEVALSFLPRGPQYFRSKSKITSSNLLFFGNSAKMNVEEIYEFIHGQVPFKEEQSELVKFFIEQIIQNSIICEIKLKHFGRAALASIAYYILLTASFIL